MRAPETPEQQQIDSDMIFTQVTCADIDTYTEAEALVSLVYILDPTVSRAGIASALERLQRHYASPLTNT